MPELPDVEVFKEYLQATALHQKISQVEVESAKILDELTSKHLREKLCDRSFTSAHRYGKYLFAEVEDDGALVFHFGMTGSLKYFKKEEQTPDHVQLQLGFANGYHLAYICPRKLGRIGWTENPERFIAEQELGDDPLQDGFDTDAFQGKLEQRRGTIKGLLMNQKALAGIGNVYSDEILFHAGIHPERQVKDLQRKERRELFDNLKNVLRTAIERQVGEKGWPEDWLLPNREPETACPQCAGTIRRTKVSGRSSYFCDKHQN